MPFDPRLLKYASAARGYVLFLGLLGVLDAMLIAAQIILIAYALSPIFYGTAGLSVTQLGWLGAVFAMRFAVNYVRTAYGHRAALRVIAQLRSQVLNHANGLGERWISGNANATVTLVTRGLDNLEAYFVQFLPQLFLSATAMPLLIVVLFYFDWISGLFVIFCIPLVPIFMILIGKLTSRYSAERLVAMQELSAQLLDLLAGIATLKGLGREKGPQRRVAQLGTTFAKKTMQTLYVAFLSGAALEFLTTLTTALVAVNIGLRMVGGSVPLAIGLIAIMLTPEILKPLREVGAQFHASADGVAAANQAFEILETPLPKRANGEIPSSLEIEISELSHYAPKRATVAPANLSATIKAGEITVLRGPSGAGKSTLVAAILGLLSPSRGSIRVGGKDIAELDIEQWWEHITWVPQHPAILPGTIAENVGQVAPEAAAITGFDDVLEKLDKGWDTPIGHGGVGLSVGQRQRLALTRALVSTRPIVILDEPSAHLDAISESAIVQAVSELKASGHTVIVIAHRFAVTEIADNLIEVRAASRDISQQVAAEAALDSSKKYARDLAAQEADYAIPQHWTQADAAGKRSGDDS